MRKYNTALFTGCLLMLVSSLQAQENLWDLISDSNETSEPVSATFKTSRVINSQSTETVKKKSLDFRITHRFGNIGTITGGIHSFFGFDNATNIRYSFEFGITDKLMIGVGRSKTREHIDGLVKYRFIEQTTDNKVPVSVAGYTNIALTPMKDVKDVWFKFAHRLSYTFQAIIARKFSDHFSLEILPTMLHRNYVKYLEHPDNGSIDENKLYAMGIAGRLKVSKRAAILADYYHPFSSFRKSNSEMPYYPPLGLGFELETGGHVFHMNFTNSAGIIENDFLPYSADNWAKGGFKFGFNISRVFVLG